MTDLASRNEAIYGYLGRFETPESLVVAIRALRDDGHQGLEAFSPYPIETLNEALGFRSRWLTVSALVMALLAAAAGYAMIWYSAEIDYPYVVGGKPLHSWPPFALLAFVLAILATALSAFIGMLLGNRLPRPYHPAFNSAMFARASSDGLFLLVVLEKRSDDDAQSLYTRLKDLAAVEIQEVPP